MLGTINQGDLDKSVNVIRGRVAMASMQLAAINGWSITYSRNKSFDPTESKIVNEIRRERLVELSFEGHRVNDLKRWAVFEDVINGFKPQGAHYQEFLDYFNNVTLLVADGFTSSNAAKCKLTQGVNLTLMPTDILIHFSKHLNSKAEEKVILSKRAEVISHLFQRLKLICICKKAMLN